MLETYGSCIMEGFGDLDAKEGQVHTRESPGHLFGSLSGKTNTR